MKKTLVIILAFALMLTMNACFGRNKGQEETLPPVAEATTAQLPEQTLPPETLAPTEAVTEPTEPTEVTEEPEEPENGVCENPFEDEETNTEPEETKKPEEDKKPENDKKPEETKPADSTKPTEKPGNDQGSSGSDEMTYEKYMNLTAAEQRDFMESFDSVDEFFAWYNAAKAEYDAQHPDIDVGDGSIDMGDIIGGNG